MYYLQSVVLTIAIVTLIAKVGKYAEGIHRCKYWAARTIRMRSLRRTPRKIVRNQENIVEALKKNLL